MVAQAAVLFLYTAAVNIAGSFATTPTKVCQISNVILQVRPATTPTIPAINLLLFPGRYNRNRHNFSSRLQIRNVSSHDPVLRPDCFRNIRLDISAAACNTESQSGFVDFKFVDGEVCDSSDGHFLGALFGGCDFVPKAADSAREESEHGCSEDISRAGCYGDSPRAYRSVPNFVPCDGDYFCGIHCFGGNFF